MSDHDCTECCGSGIEHNPGHYVPGEQFVEPPSEDMCGACLGTGSRAAQEIRADRDRLRARVAELEAAGGDMADWIDDHRTPGEFGPETGAEQVDAWRTVSTTTRTTDWKAGEA